MSSSYNLSSGGRYALIIQANLKLNRTYSNKPLLMEWNTLMEIRINVFESFNVSDGVPTATRSISIFRETYATNCFHCKYMEIGIRIRLTIGNRY